MIGMEETRCYVVAHAADISYQLHFNKGLLIVCIRTGFTFALHIIYCNGFEP